MLFVVVQLVGGPNPSEGRVEVHSRGRWGSVCANNATEVSLFKFLLFVVVRLVGGPNPSEGRVEVHSRGRWGSVCANDMDITTAQTICKQLGMRGKVHID